MSYLSVSGLRGDEEDALQNLLQHTGSKSANVGASENIWLEAIQRVSALSNEGHVPEALVEHNKPRPSLSCPSRATRKTKATSTREKKATAHDAKHTALPRTDPDGGGVAEPASSRFLADNPANVDSLSPVLSLVHPKLRRTLEVALHVRQFTRIQALSWKAMLDPGRDVIIRSETGSGKTLAYALPTAHRVLCDCDTQPIRREVGTIVIVMCPTRELVIQVDHTFTTLLKCAQFLTVGGIHGGENRHKEKARLRKGVPILITTPGRLLDHLKATTAFNVAHIHCLVMDEADRLLDMGFEKAIREIMDLLTAKCEEPGALKRVLVSATITDGVERLSHFALRPAVTRIGETQDTFSVPATLRQHFVSLPIKHRLPVLIGFLRSQFDAGASKIIVFVSTADSAEFLYYLLSRLQSPFLGPEYEGRVELHRSIPKYKKMMSVANQHLHDAGEAVVTFDENSGDDDDLQEPAMNQRASLKAMLEVNVFKLHGNMSQLDRASVFHAFKFGTPNAVNQQAVLFCTDVAARGLDMPLVDWIVHFDPPTDATSYVHRIGRTARIGNNGDSILFLAPHEVGYAGYLANFVNSGGGRGEGEARTRGTDAEPLLVMTEKKYETFLFYLTKLDPKSNHMWMHSAAKLMRAIVRLVMHASPTAPVRAVEGRAEKEDNLCRIALFAYQSYIRAYAGISKNLKKFFPSSALHLGHVAQSFGIDKSPTEVQRQLQSYIREDRSLARSGKAPGRPNNDDSKENPNRRKRARVELEHNDRYHSMLAQKRRKETRDYEEKRREAGVRIRPLQFTEFDA